MPQLTGSLIGPYRVEGLIGEGGMSVVYQAVDTRTNQRVALKLLRLEHSRDRKQVERFWRGAQSAKALQHPHIVPVYEAGLSNGYYYVSMMYLDGGSVEDLVRRGPLSLAHVAAIVHQVASALDYAHSRQVIHRDIKPSNILLSSDGATTYLSDFGIARITGQETVTEFGTLVGTPEYMSPEQILGRQLDGRTDIYSLGVTVYQMLSGDLPFKGEPAPVLYGHVHTQPRSLTSLNRAIPRPMAAAVNRAMAKDPNNRYPKAGILADDLTAALTRTPTRWPLWAALGGLAALLLIIFFVFVKPPPPTTTTPVPTIAEVTLTPGTVKTTVAAATEVTPTSTPADTLVPGESEAPDDSGAVTVTAEPVDTSETTAPVLPPNITETPATIVSITSPPDGAVIPIDKPQQAFAWQMNRPLADDEWYELRFTPAGGVTEPLIRFKEAAVTDDFLNRLHPGDYRWQVVVIRADSSDRWLADVAASEINDLVWGR